MRKEVDTLADREDVAYYKFDNGILCVGCAGIKVFGWNLARPHEEIKDKDAAGLVCSACGLPHGYEPPELDPGLDLDLPF